MIKFTLKELRKWSMFVGLKWAESIAKTAGRDYIMLDEMPYSWKAWGLYHAGRYWPDDQYTPEIGKALAATRYTGWINFARLYWPENRKGDLER